MERKTTPAPYASDTTPAPASQRALALDLALELAEIRRSDRVSPELAALLAADRDAVELEIDALFSDDSLGL